MCTVVKVCKKQQVDPLYASDNYHSLHSFRCLYDVLLKIAQNFKLVYRQGFKIVNLSLCSFLQRHSLIHYYVGFEQQLDTTVRIRL